MDSYSYKTKKNFYLNNEFSRVTRSKVP